MRALPATAFALALILSGCDSGGAPDASGTGSAEAAAGSTAGASETSPAPDARPAAVDGGTAQASSDIDSNPPGDECGASKVAAYVTQEATPAVRARLTADVGHDRIRWVGPDTALTMDFRPDRLNVSLDKDDIITGGKCS